MPGATGANHAGFPIGVGAGHVHPILNEDAQQAFADLAALDTSGYAPCEGIAPNGGSNAEHPLYQEGFAAGLASRQAPRMRSLRGSVPS
jgi:hypothetical protein